MRSAVSLQLTPNSVSSFQSSLLGAVLRVDSAAGAGIDEAANQVFNLSQSRVPRVTGALANSGKITAQDQGLVHCRQISYGDSTANPRTGKSTASYAALVHEVYNVAHPNSYKWLELSMLQFGQDGFITVLADALRAAF